jgi:biopolymer transport protein ExbD
MIFIIQQRHLMASILPQPPVAGKRKQHSLRIDMTPMVDLGFLLITFFIFTATLSQPRITRLIMPKDGEPADVAASRSLTLLLAKEKVMVYEGRWEDAVSNRTLSESTYHLQMASATAYGKNKKQ